MLKGYCLAIVQTSAPAARDWSVLDQSMGKQGFEAVEMLIGICRVSFSPIFVRELLTFV